MTGALLGADGGSLAGRLHLDVLYPVKGRKRCFDPQNGYGGYPDLLPASLSSLYNCFVSAWLVCVPAEPDTAAAYTGQGMLATSPLQQNISGCCVILQSSHTRHSGWQISASISALLRGLSEPTPSTRSLCATGGHDAIPHVSCM